MLRYLPTNLSVREIAGEQDNFAWAVFGEIATDLGERTKLSIALRYDEDTRENTT